MQLSALSFCLTLLAMLAPTAIATPTPPNTEFHPRSAEPAAAFAAAPAQAPWLLSAITIFQAKPSTAGASYIHFTFADTREGLRLTTDCRRFVLPGGTPSINDAANGYPCANDTVAFTYSQGKFDIVRNYQDSSVGPPGLDSVTAFGGATTTFTTTNGGCATKQTLASLPAQITAIIA